MAYSEKLLDHYENPRNVGSFTPGAVMMAVFAPLDGCGDQA